MSLKLIFGLPVAEQFIYTKQLYYSIKKFCHDPLVLFSSDKDIGHSYDRLRKIKNKREYKYHQLQNFIFDALEEIRNLNFDYFIKLDSDCLFANSGIDGIFAGKFDFLDSVDENDGKCNWLWAKKFSENIGSYHRILSDLGLSRKDARISGCLGAFQVHSKEAVNFIADRINIIENNPGYLTMKQKGLCLDELIVPNLLKDAGFAPRLTYLHEGAPQSSWRMRWRPYIGKEEVAYAADRDLNIMYHPLKRDLRDEARRILLEKIGYRYGLKDMAALSYDRMSSLWANRI